MSGSRIRSYRVERLDDFAPDFDDGTRTRFRFNPPARYRVSLEVDADEAFVAKLAALVEAENAPCDDPNAPTMRMLPAAREDDDAS